MDDEGAPVIGMAVVTRIVNQDSYTPNSYLPEHRPGQIQHPQRRESLMPQNFDVGLQIASLREEVLTKYSEVCHSEIPNGSRVPRITYKTLPTHGTAINDGATTFPKTAYPSTRIDFGNRRSTRYGVIKTQSSIDHIERK